MLHILRFTFYASLRRNKKLPDLHGEVRQQWRLQSIILVQCFRQMELRLLAPVHLDLPLPPVDDPVFPDTAPRVQLEL